MSEIQTRLVLEISPEISVFFHIPSRQYRVIRNGNHSRYIATTNKQQAIGYGRDAAYRKDQEVA